MGKVISEKLFEQLREHVKKHLATAPGCHDMDHTMRVYNNALTIYEMEHDGDIQVIRTGALLHDIARPEEMLSEGGLCHAMVGAESAEKILKDFGVGDEEFISRVAEVVRKHRYRDECHPQTIEEKIVYDADKLDSIGAVGVGRAFHFAGRIRARLHNTREEALNSSEYSVNDSAYREYLVKLREVPGRMLTASGRKLAEERAQFMHDFFDRLNYEVYGF